MEPAPVEKPQPSGTDQETSEASANEFAPSSPYADDVPSAEEERKSKEIDDKKRF